LGELAAILEFQILDTEDIKNCPGDENAHHTVVAFARAKTDASATFITTVFDSEETPKSAI
jgi:hypothetical protein